MGLVSLLIKAVGYVGNELVKQGTGIDIKDSLGEINKVYSRYERAYNSLMENKDLLIEIHGYDWFETRKQLLLDGCKSAMKGEIKSISNEPYVKAEKYVTGKLEELTDEQLQIVRKKNKENKKILSLIDGEISSRKK